MEQLRQRTTGWLMETNLPNALTVSRILATPICLLLFLERRSAVGWRSPSGSTLA